MNYFGIIGAGTMGTDIALMIAELGYKVFLHDIDGQKLTEARGKIEDRMNRYEQEGRITLREKGEILGRIEMQTDMAPVSKVDVVIECVTEDLEIKREVFRRLDELCRPGVLLASNTSSKSITAIASATKRPESVIGMHFMNPVRVMQLVEIVCGLATTRESFEMAKQIVKKCKKKHVEAQDFPGFLANRILMPMINEAIFALYEGAGTVEAIDLAMRLGMNQRMGPLQLADLIGLDIVLAVIEELYRGFGDTKYRPCPLLKNYVAAGYLGKKSGRGFYTY